MGAPDEKSNTSYKQLFAHVKSLEKQLREKERELAVLRAKAEQDEDD